MKRRFLGVFTLLLLAMFTHAQKARTIITTDGELDDVDSFIRMLLYSNEFKIEGLVVSSSMWHYSGDGRGTKFTSEMEMTKRLYGERTELRWPGTQWIYELVDAYTQVQPSLAKHGDYPSGKKLQSLIRIGNIEFEGEMDKDTDGSDHIKLKLLDDDPSPIYLQAWGGTNTIARALKSIEEEYVNRPNWQDIYKKVSKKAIIYTILDQDATYRKYVSQKWPDIKILYNANQFWSFAYFWKRAVPSELQKYLQGDFMGPIINNSGPLLKKYYSYGDGNPPLGELEDIYSDPEKAKKNMWGSFSKFDFISEGDSPAFLHLVDTGLENLQHSEYGGWGGRLIQSKTSPSRFEDGKLAADFNPYTNKIDSAYAQTRWMQAIQNDFATRASWCVNDFKSANHIPRITLVGPKKYEIKAGNKINIKFSTSDPDGNKTTTKSWFYKECSNAVIDPIIQSSNNNHVIVKIPSDAKRGDIFHLILETQDTVTMPLSAYKRVIISVK